MNLWEYFLNSTSNVWNYKNRISCSTSMFIQTAKKKIDKKMIWCSNNLMKSLEPTLVTRSPKNVSGLREHLWWTFQHDAISCSLVTNGSLEQYSLRMFKDWLYFPRESEKQLSFEGLESFVSIPSIKLYMHQESPERLLGGRQMNDGLLSSDAWKVFMRCQNLLEIKLG